MKKIFSYLCNLNQQASTMNEISNNIFITKNFWRHVIGVPLFVFGFFLLFCPYSFKHFEITFADYSFHVTMVFCIVLLVVAATRVVLRLIHKRFKFNLIQYFVACFLEIAIAAAFSALYLWLCTRNRAYFEYFAYFLVYLTVAMGLPDLLFLLYTMLGDTKKKMSEEVDKGPDDKIKFLDERDNVKFVVALDSILYIQSEENYLKIFYLNDNKVSSYLLRSSMKKVEEMCAKNGLIRCHRSYFVNKTRVKLMQKEKDFTYAVLDVPNTAHIPVSKNYYDQVSAIL